MKTILIFFALLFSQNAFATSDFCEFLEGIPLPACLHSKYHTCKSGVAEQAVYYQMSLMVNTIDDPATSTCAQNATVCTTSCSSASDGGGCSVNCQCTSVTPLPQSCHTACQACIVDKSPTVDYGVICQKFCNEPPHLSNPIIFNGTLYYGKNNSEPACSTDQKCAPGTVDVGGPKSAAECTKLSGNGTSFKVDDYNYGKKGLENRVCTWYNKCGRAALLAAHAGDSTYNVDDHGTDNGKPCPLVP